MKKTAILLSCLLLSSAIIKVSGEAEQASDRNSSRIKNLESAKAKADIIGGLAQRQIEFEKNPSSGYQDNFAREFRDNFKKLNSEDAEAVALSIRRFKNLAYAGAKEKADSYSATLPNGLTALHVLCSKKAFENENAFKRIKLLITSGAEVNATTNRGRTPLDYANRLPDGEKKAKIIDLLKRNGAQTGRRIFIPIFLGKFTAAAVTGVAIWKRKDILRATKPVWKPALKMTTSTLKKLAGQFAEAKSLCR